MNRSNYDTGNRFGANTLKGSLFKKKARATQNFNMAAIFQDGHYGYPETHIFVLKGQQMVEKGNYDDKFYVLIIADAQIML